MKVNFKTGSEVNYGSTNGEMFFASDTKQLLLNGVKYIPKKLSELTNDSGFLTSITKSMVENVLTGNITSHTHSYLPLSGGTMTGSLTIPNIYITGDVSVLPSHYFHYLYQGATDVYEHFGNNDRDKITYGNFRFYDGNGSYKTLRIGGDGTFKWNGTYVSLEGHAHTFASLTSKPTTLSGYGITDAALASDLSRYLPLTGGTITGNLTCNGSWIEKSGSSGGFVGYFNTPKRSDRAGSSHIFNSGWAYGTNAVSLGAAAYAGIRNTDSDSGTYPYLHWQWMDCLQVKETTSGTAVNCYGAILTNAGGNKDTATFSLCMDGMCVAYGGTGNSEELNNFLSFTNTNTSYGRVVVYIADNKSGDTNERIFGGTTSRPRSQSNVKIGNVLLGQGCNITDVASMSVNGVTVYRVAFYFWNKTLSASYDITKKTTAIVCTKVNNTNYSGASSYASGFSSVASGYSSVASGYSSVASGFSSVASGYYSVASGSYSVASGSYSVASGYYSVASGFSSVASGYSSVASGSYSVASGYSSVAKHEGSKVYALRGISGINYQTVLGRDNVETSAASVVVGWGSSDTARKNIFVLDTTGNATFGSGGAASVTAATFNGSLNGNATNASKLATARTIKVGSASKSFDGSGDIEFTLDSIITQSDTINVGVLNVAEQTTTKNITIGNNLTISSGADISGLTPSMIGALENKYIAHKEDYQLYAILLCKIGTNTTNKAHTINGVFYSHSNGGSRYQAAYVNIHSSNWSTLHDEYYGFTPFGIGSKCRLVTCTYQDAQYLAITFENTQATNIYFDGSSINMLFTPILYYTENTHTINNPEIYNSIADVVYNKTPIISSLKTTLTSSNYNSYSPKLDGTGATGTWGISISGNAATATTTAEADMLTTTCNITIGNTKKAFNGSQSTLSWTLAEIGAAAASHTHTFASLTGKPTTLSGYGITDAYTKTETNTELGKYLSLTGGTLNGALTVPKLTSTGGILLGDSSLSAMVGSVGIQRHDETGFIGFLKDFNLGNSFNGVVLGWDGNYSLQENSVRIDASTFTYKGNSVLHSGNLGYTSSGLSRAVQKDTNGNLYIVAPSLFEQGISNNYPKNLRWSNETEGQLVYDKEIEAGNFDTVEISIPLANGTSKGFLKSTSEVTNVTGYTPCPVVSGTPYYKYKEDCLYLGSTEIGYTGIMEYGIQHTYNYGTKLPYLEDYTPDSIPRCVVLCFPDRSSNYRFLFWLSAFDDADPYIARFYNSAYETWLTIDTTSRQIILSYGNTWQS